LATIWSGKGDPCSIDEANIAHVAEHDVLPHEAEEVIENQPIYLDHFVEDGEERYREIGEAHTGRVLIVVSTLRNERTRVSRPMPRNDQYC
jgi:uncharacterized protein